MRRRSTEAAKVRKMLAFVALFAASHGGRPAILPLDRTKMATPTEPGTARRPPRLNRSTLLRVLGNAGLLVFASLCVIALVARQYGAALLWGGALLVFFAPAFDRLTPPGAAPSSRLARGADALRWCGLALAAAGAALTFA